ncbi:unnamed protein product [Rotaria magnacalcarata]|uniref:Uncharacterized protein n=1 Tax=Rotaria magnacalcarata TaxID=392030 RepID=A0A815BB19_9BILA|nr:unnamed protein product [Rotaria magnacalcarata]CAF4092896.1 unnamed protein product [Rotaria magnacalcarata]
MASSFIFSFGFIFLFIICISCTPIYFSSPNDDENQSLYGQLNSNEDDDHIPIMVYPKYPKIHNFRRSASYSPRNIHNSWFRVATYQHMKPTAAAEDKPNGDNLLRWG